MQLRKHAIIFIAAAAVGCGHSASSDSDTEPADTNTKMIGPARVDQPRNGSVEVDEKALHAELHDSDIELSIPVRGVRAGVGSVTAELISVDGSQVVSSMDVDFELDNAQEKTLQAHFELPDDVKEQADRAAYSVRVRDDKDTLRVTRSLMYVLTPYELQLEGPSSLRVEHKGSYRVRAQAVPTREPLVDETVALDVMHDGEVSSTLHGTTDESGSAIFAVDMDKPGMYSLAVASGAEKLSGDVNVRESDQKMLLTTDKPIYQPGQTIHLRAMALQSPDNKPLSAAELLFEVSDGKGNKVFKKTRKTDDYGIASVDFKLASLVNMGSYKLQVSGGTAKAEKAVDVSRYVLPKLDVKVATDKAWYKAGAELRGTADARYFFGKLVGGADVLVEALTLDVSSQVFQRVMGKTDEQGRYAFTIKLPEVLAGLPIQNGNALVTLRTTVTDTAGQVVQKETPITVAADAIQLSLVPEATQVVPDIENRFHLFATDPLGAPIAKAEVQVSGPAAIKAQTDDFGHIELSWKVSSLQATVTVDLTAHDGSKAHGDFSFAAQGGAEHVLVRTDKSLYNLGETVKVQVLGTRSETRAYLDWLNDGQAVDMRTLELKDGVASFELQLDTAYVGENRIEAYVVDDGGNSIRAGRTIIVQKDGALQVELSQDKSEYRPGEPAKLTFSVTDRAGKPAPSALGVQIVDEAVFGLIDARPGLLRTFFELEDSFAMPQYEIHAPQVNFEQLLFEDAAASSNDRKQAAQAQAEAQLSALRNQRMLGLSLGSWQLTAAHADSKLAPYYTADRQRLIDALAPTVKAATDTLAMMGCRPQMFACRSSDYGTQLGRLINGMFSLYDFWGTRYTSGQINFSSLSYVSAGPDEMLGTKDDKTLTISLQELGVSTPVVTAPSTNAGAFGAAGSAATVATGATAATPPAAMAGAAKPSSAEGDAASSSMDSPRVRSDFPETLYVNPALITDADGKADVSLDMADSITSWRVSTLANAKSGGLGGGQGAIKVFQDFFVDVSFPAELTRGDYVEFPVVVYNYLKTEQTVRLELESASWFTAMGTTTTSLTLAADSVQSVKIPVRIEKVGAQTLTVRAFGTNASDAVARSVRVVPDGTQVANAQSGSLAQGSKSLTVDIASNAIEGSPLLYLDVYPGFTSQVVQGLDSMLQVPNGCFEQTTSTTWPNVLITQYLNQTKQTSPAIQLKAESYISAGYQRLLTYEHRSGGYSLWGETQGAAQADISLTSFGLIEFSDMAKVSDVDPDMIARTQNWLATQQQADGSYTGRSGELFALQSSLLRSTALAAWGLAASGYKGDALGRALDFVRAQLASSTPQDTYSLALAANALAIAAPADAALMQLLDKLDSGKVEDGGKIHWASGTAQTDFYGAGQDADVSTTALIANALIATSTHGASVKGVLEYLISSKDTNGNFGSTQATVWSLKALMLAAERGTEGAVGELQVKVDGQDFNKVTLEKDEADLNTRVDMSSLATTGDHTIELAFTGSGQLSYNLISAYHVPWATAAQSSGGPLAINVSYDRTSLAVDETVQANLEIRNLTRSTQSMLLVTVGVPPGFELQTDDLDAYVQKGRISRYERTAKQLILYVDQIEANTTLPLAYHLKATMPVRAADGGSQVSLYYQPDQRAGGASTTLVATAN